MLYLSNIKSAQFLSRFFKRAEGATISRRIVFDAPFSVYAAGYKYAFSSFIVNEKVNFVY